MCEVHAFGCRFMRYDNTIRLVYKFGSVTPLDSFQIGRYCGTGAQVYNIAIAVEKTAVLLLGGPQYWTWS